VFRGFFAREAAACAALMKFSFGAPQSLIFAGHNSAQSRRATTDRPGLIARDRHPPDRNGVSMTTIVPASVPTALHQLSRSFVVQALIATAAIALVSASSPAATADPAAVPSGPTTLAAR